MSINYKIIKNNINGVLLFDKPYGLSSNTALQKVKHLYKAKKAGHTGTLDPLATGLLPLCFGEATKFSNFLLDADKEYIATIKLGITTTTYDAEGETIATNEVNVSSDTLVAVVQSFVGNIIQVPPIYSALKVKGKPLYQYARNNEEVEIKSRTVTIHEIEVIKFESPDILQIRVLCSKGTYIRSLAHDIGQKLGCGAHLIALTRTKTSGFTLEEAIPLERLQGCSLEELTQHLLPIDVLVGHLERLEISDIDYTKLQYGHAFDKCLNNAENTILSLYYQGRFLGIGKFLGNTIQPIRLINQTK